MAIEDEYIELRRENIVNMGKFEVDIGHVLDLISNLRDLDVSADEMRACMLLISHRIGRLVWRARELKEHNGWMLANHNGDNEGEIPF